MTLKCLSAVFSRQQETSINGVVKSTIFTTKVTKSTKIDDSEETIGYLSALPLVAGYGEALFTHSLPFAEKLGLSSMIRGMGRDEAALFFGPLNPLFPSIFGVR